MQKISLLKLPDEFLNKIITEEKNIYDQIFREYFDYQSASFFVKDLYVEKQNKNEIIVKYLAESLIDLRNSINSKEIPGNENPIKAVNIVEKIFDFNKQQKEEEIKILTPKQMLQKLPIVFPQ